MGDLLESRCHYPKLFVPDTTRKGRISIPTLLHQREINGKSLALSRVRAWNRLCHLKMPSSLQVNDDWFDLLRDGIFLGMSNDSGYVVGILYGSSLDRHTGMDVDIILTVMQLSPTKLILAFMTRLNSTRLFEVFATFPRDSSFISVLSFTEDVTGHGASRNEPLTTLVALDFVLFKRMLHVSMRTSVVLSSRWRTRMCRTLLRCFDCGAILNAGTMLVCVLFTKQSLSIEVQSRPDRTSFQVLRVADADRTEWAGAVLQEITVSDARPRIAAVDRAYYALLSISTKQPPVTSHGLKESLFVTEVLLDIEKLLLRLTPAAVQDFLPDHHYVGLVDYEVDVVGCDGWTVYVMVSVIVEIKGPGLSGTNRPYIGIIDAEWNTYNGELESRSWRPFIAVSWERAQRPNKWYPFQSKQAPNVDERVISNEAFLAGESLKLLTSPFPGIGLYR